MWYINTQVKRQGTWDWKGRGSLGPKFFFHKIFIEDMKNRTMQKPTKGWASAGNIQQAAVLASFPFHPVFIKLA